MTNSQLVRWLCSAVRAFLPPIRISRCRRTPDSCLAPALFKAALTATTGIRPIVIGKPEPLMLELAMSQLGGSLADTVMLGDRLDTDIQGANALGISSILILTGVSSRRDIDESHAKPTLVVENLASLVQRWTQGDVS